MADESEPGLSGPNDKGRDRSQTYANAEEYFVALRNWLHNVYMWQNITATFPYALMTNQFGHSGAMNLQHFGGIQNGTSAFPHMTSVQSSDVLRNRRPQVAAVRPTQHQQNTVPENGIEYRIPPLWKRFAAEFLDFLILLLLKLTVTFVVADSFHFIKLDKYVPFVLQRNFKLDYKMAMEMTSEILLMEFIHRIVVCIFETFWLHRGMGGYGGATPGKTMMGIRVVLCTKVTQIPGRPADVVAVYPGTDLGVAWAFSRAFVKNLVLAVLLPIFFVLFILRHNRTGYDILCNAIVVEDLPRRRH